MDVNKIQTGEEDRGQSARLRGRLGGRPCQMTALPAVVHSFLGGGQQHLLSCAFFQHSKRLSSWCDLHATQLRDRQPWRDCRADAKDLGSSGRLRRRGALSLWRPAHVHIESRPRSSRPEVAARRSSGRQSPSAGVSGRSCDKRTLPSEQKGGRCKADACQPRASFVGQREGWTWGAVRLPICVRRRRPGLPLAGAPADPS